MEGIPSLAASALYAGMVMANNHLGIWAALCANVVMILAFCALIVWRDFPLSSLPVIGKYFK